MKRPQQRGRKSEPKLAKVTPIKRESRTPVKKSVAVRNKNIVQNLKQQSNRFRGGSRQKRVILITLLASFIALIALVLATLVTPMLAVEKIKVTGLSKVPEKAVLAAVKSNLGKPLALVSQQEIANELKPFTLIESISIISELPHTLHIAVSERQPIAIVDIAGASVLFDAAGVNLGIAKNSDQVPRVLINDNPKSSKAFAEAIDVLLALPAELLPSVSVIDAKSKDDVRLQLRGYSGQLIIWGDASQGVLKSKVLAALIKNQKVTDRVTYDVSSPSAPVVRYH